MSVESSRNSVVLPPPLGPSSAKISPRCTSRSRPASACRAPYRWTSRETEIAAEAFIVLLAGAGIRQPYQPEQTILPADLSSQEGRYSCSASLGLRGGQEDPQSVIRRTG